MIALGCGSFQTAEDKIKVLMKERLATSWHITALLEQRTVPVTKNLLSHAINVLPGFQ